MPMFVLVLGVLIAPLPGFVTGDLGVLAYLRATMLPLGIFALLIWVTTGTVRRWEIATWPGWAARAVLAPPVARDLVRARSRVVMLEHLALLLAAGEPAGDAVPAAIECVANPRLRASYASAKSSLDDGSPVAHALREAGLLHPDSGYPVVSAGEAAGRLAASLEHHVGMEDESLTQTYESIFEWIPRLVYCGVLALLASSFFL